MNKLVILDQKLEDWVTKGEVQKNYFNRDNLFKEITVLTLVKSRKPPNEILSKLCGTKRFKFLQFKNEFLRNNFIKYLLPFSFYKFLLSKELKNLSIPQPKEIMSFGDGYSGYISGVLSCIFKCKLILSIHSFTNIMIFFNLLSFKEKVIYLLNLRFKKKSHQFAHNINIVYKKIEEGIGKEFRSKIKLKYNQIDIKKHNKKLIYKNSQRLSLVFVGRLIKGKSLINVIKSLVNLKDISLTVYGDGPERKNIERLIDQYKLNNKVFLKGFEKNEIIINKIKRYDAFIAYHKFYEFPKTIIEALSTGIPIILNSKPSKEVYEFKKFNIIWTEDNSESYTQKIIDFRNGKYDLKLMKKNNEIQIKKLLNSNYD